MYTACLVSTVSTAGSKAGESSDSRATHDCLLYFGYNVLLATFRCSKGKKFPSARGVELIAPGTMDHIIKKYIACSIDYWVFGNRQHILYRTRYIFLQPSSAVQGMELI